MFIFPRVLADNTISKRKVIFVLTWIINFYIGLRIFLFFIKFCLEKKLKKRPPPLTQYSSHENKNVLIFLIIMKIKPPLKMAKALSESAQEN